MVKIDAAHWVDHFAYTPPEVIASFEYRTATLLVLEFIDRVIRKNQPGWVFPSFVSRNMKPRGSSRLPLTREIGLPLPEEQFQQVKNAVMYNDFAALSPEQHDFLQRIRRYFDAIYFSPEFRRNLEREIKE